MVVNVPVTWIMRAADASAEASPLQVLPIWSLYLLAMGCLSLAAVVAGLTLGLMSLDMVGLEILQSSKEPKEREQATQIAEIRRDGNLLLVTLLLTNTIAMELLPLVLDAIFPGSMLSLVLAVILVMLFGEIIPQAVCSRHALEIGAMFVGLVKILRFLLYPIAKPIAICLDVFLGQEMGQIYTREELKGLVDVHNRNKYGVLTSDEASILKGTLDLESKNVAQIMTKAENVFMLDVDGKLGRDNLKSILHYGHSRVPLYHGQRSNVVGLLLTKQLILIDPDDEIPIRAIFNKKKRAHKIKVAPPVCVSADCKIHELLNEFQIGRSHLAIVYDDVLKDADSRKLQGIVTLEDIIEEILQEEIVDETDVYQDNQSRKPVLTRNKDGRLVRSTPQAEILAAQRLKGTNHIIIREIDVQEMQQPLRQMLDSSYGATSSSTSRAPPAWTPTKSQRVIQLEIPHHLADDLSLDGAQSAARASQPGFAELVSSGAEGQTGDVVLDMTMSEELEMEESTSSKQSTWKSALKPETSSTMDGDPTWRPTTAPPRVEYDEEDWAPTQIGASGKSSSAIHDILMPPTPRPGTEAAKRMEAEAAKNLQDKERFSLDSASTQPQPDAQDPNAQISLGPLSGASVGGQPSVKKVPSKRPKKGKKRGKKN
ncbi:hypothetical protein NDN08_006006 [Rhodosorus marinus]|uniref:CNNM transmembrane domain-containing protein n=1 Tax=Rhodosorus marinus TaxID=101924 RepID=A0AAV8UML9_9RHOD|nr:hypothetical protein NDN08_006006 [Rhodosorus marinus]